MSDAPTPSNEDGKMIIIIFCVGLLVTLFLFLSFVTAENAVLHNKTITVSGKICESPLSSQYGTLTDENGEFYHFPSEDCQKYSEGKSVNISYRRIHQMGISDEFDFNRIVGSPVICEEPIAVIDKCSKASEIVVLASIYKNATDKDPLWTQVKASTECGDVRHYGYSQNHILLVPPEKKLTLTVIRVFDPETGNITLVKAKPVYLYPMDVNEYHIVMSEL